MKGRKKAGLGTVWVQNKEESPGTLEIPGLSLAEKERFELRENNENWYYFIKLCADQSKNFVLIFQTVIIHENPVVAWLWHWLGSAGSYSARHIYAKP